MLNLLNKFRRKQPRLSFQQSVENARKDISLLKVDLIRGKISQHYYYANADLIVKKHYSNLKLSSRLTVSVRKFKNNIKNL